MMADDNYVKVGYATVEGDDRQRGVFMSEWGGRRGELMLGKPEDDPLHGIMTSASLYPGAITFHFIADTVVEVEVADPESAQSLAGMALCECGAHALPNGERQTCPVCRPESVNETDRPFFEVTGEFKITSPNLIPAKPIDMSIYSGAGVGA